MGKKRNEEFTAGVIRFRVYRIECANGLLCGGLERLAVEQLIFLFAWRADSAQSAA